jgi:hypothetical protein
LTLTGSQQLSAEARQKKRKTKKVVSSRLTTASGSCLNAIPIDTMSYDYLTFLFFNRKYTAKERLTSTAGTCSVICELFLQKAYMPAEEDDKLKTSLILRKKKVGDTALSKKKKEHLR